MSKKFFKDGNNDTPLHFAAKNGWLDICMLLWENCEEKNVPGLFGLTPLHLAAKHGHLDVYNFILGRLDEKEPLDIDGRSPIAFAKHSKCLCHNRKFIEKWQSNILTRLIELNYFQANINYGNLRAHY